MGKHHTKQIVRKSTGSFLIFCLFLIEVEGFFNTDTIVQCGSVLKILKPQREKFHESHLFRKSNACSLLKNGKRVAGTTSFLLSSLEGPREETIVGTTVYYYYVNQKLIFVCTCFHPVRVKVQRD